MKQFFTIKLQVGILGIYGIFLVVYCEVINYKFTIC